MSVQKCNHLVVKEFQESKCDSSNPYGKSDFWLPTRIEAKPNGMIMINFYCKYCDKRTSSYITQEEYASNRRILGG